MNGFGEEKCGYTILEIPGMVWVSKSMRLAWDCVFSRCCGGSGDGGGSGGGGGGGKILRGWCLKCSTKL